MAPIAISFLAFALALVGILLGSVMQRMLPEGHLSSDSKEVVKLGMGVVATLAALVLGLLVASAKGTYDARESEINQITAYSSCSIICLRNMERRLKPRELRCAKQSQQSSIESGEKGNLCLYGQLHSRHRLKAKRSISGFKNFNQATTSNVD
jgi:hypothetical protein